MTHRDTPSREGDPPLSPSQEGIFSLRRSFITIPSWEGKGVGFFQARFRLKNVSPQPIRPLYSTALKFQTSR